MFKPTINSTYKVIPRINPQLANRLNQAVGAIEELLSLFTVGSEGFERLSVFLQTFKVASQINFDPESLYNKYHSLIVFVYDITSPNENPFIYSSINRALKGLQISYGGLFNNINNNYLLKSKFILSFEQLSVEKRKFYIEKPKGDNQLRKLITVYNQDNEIFVEFKSGREMARYFNIDGKVARAAIAKGEFQDFLLIVKEISFRKTVYVFDSNTLELIETIEGLSKAIKFAKVNFYTLKNLLENSNSYHGKIYSYKDKL